MARMVPPDFDANATSGAERRIFDQLRNDPATDEWTVLHSLGLARRGKKPYGEIDFVVLLPSGGVYCIEVKGGRIACTGGLWSTTDKDGRTAALKRSPFLQAREGMFALRDAVLKRAPVGFPADLLFGYAVVFPDISFDVESPEWERWQVIDRESLRRPVSEAILKVSRNCRALHGHTHSVRQPTPETIRIIKQLLRPDFDIVVTRATQIQDTEESLCRLTEEQYDVLDMLESNDRALVEGAAGTGKTMLALEFARRSAVTGRRTLLLCYNQLLGDWLSRRVADFGLGDRLVAGRHFQLLRQAIVSTNLREAFLREERESDQARLFREVLPLYGVEAIGNLNKPFQQIVVDEAQDLIAAPAIEVWSAWMHASLKDARWAIFGDFHRQAIFTNGPRGEELKQLIAKAAGHYARLPLRQNCRNTRNIAEETALLSGFDAPPYRMGTIHGLPVDYRYYSDPETQCRNFVEVVGRLLRDGVHPRDITVLSKLRLENSVLLSVRQGHGFLLHEIGTTVDRKANTPSMAFSTIYAFKGMESPVVILCDVDDLGDGEAQALVYVGMSRARSCLVVLIDERARGAVQARIRKRLEGTGRTT
jgi:hypothetical protein